MIEEFSFTYTYKGKTKEKKVVTNSLAEAFDKASIFLESLDDRIDLLGLENWEDIQDECDSVGITVGDLIVIDE